MGDYDVNRDRKIIAALYVIVISFLGGCLLVYLECK